MPSSSDVDTPLLNCISPLYGTSLEMPPILRSPGTASIANLFSGIGHPGSISGAAANFMPTPQGPFSFKSTGMGLCIGTLDIKGALTVTGSTLFLGGFTGATSLWKLETGVYNITSKGQVTLGSAGATKISSGGIMVLAPKKNLSITSPNMRGNGTVMTGFNISACTGKKDFDISHPTKDGWRLRHVCIEGPTADVYIRGTLNNSNVIQLPDYWSGLVDTETITVSLTPMGTYQELFVEKIENNKVIIKNNSSSSIKCQYLICGERKDVEKNIPEYQGEYKDYPGDNNQYVQFIQTTSS